MPSDLRLPHVGPWESCTASGGDPRKSKEHKTQVPLVLISPFYQCAGISRISTLSQWPTMIFFANSLQSGFLPSDMPFGSHLRGIFITSWGLVTSVSSAKADSIAYSISCCPTMILPTEISVSPTTTNLSSPKCPNMSYLVYVAPITSALPKLPWTPMNWGTLLRGY